MNANGHIDLRVGLTWGVELLLACLSLNDVARSMEHVQDVLGLDLGFFLVSRQPAHATSKQRIKACSRRL